MSAPRGSSVPHTYVTRTGDPVPAAPARPSDKAADEAADEATYEATYEDVAPIRVDERPARVRPPITRRRRVIRRIRRGVLAVIVLVLIPVFWSYGHALTRPGSDSLGIRSTEWIKDNGGRGLVAWAEKTWYQHHAPKKGGQPLAKDIPAVTAPAHTGTTSLADVPAPPHLLVSQPLDGEGVWQPGPRSASGAPLVYTTFIQPSAEYSSLITGLAWLDPKRVRFQLFAGSEQPGGAGWHQMAPLPFSVRPGLVGAFNSGFKLSDSHGGYYAEGRVAPGHPLLDGQASLILYNDGRATVGAWGRDAQMGPNIAAVRQNLVLLIDNGQEAADLNRDSLVRWGFTPGNKTFVWRSGVGVDAGGHLIYAAGELTVHALADVLQAAGAVRAMELDINSTWVHFFTYHDDPSVPGGTGGGKLLPQMSAPTDLYFKPSSRDFIAAFSNESR